MRSYTILVFIFTLLISCSGSDNAVDTVLSGTESGAFVRTIEINNSDLILDDSNSSFNALLEVQDEEDGNLLETLEVFVRFIDNTIDGTNSSSEEVLIRTLMPNEFFNGPNGLPRINLNLSYTELTSATGIASNLIACKDQFIVRLAINLTDGRSFSNNTIQSSAVIALDTIFSSPFCYTLNIASPISSAEFTGLYRYTSIIDGYYGPTFGPSRVVEISIGDSVNSREFTTDYIASRPNEASRVYKFIVSCDEILFRKNQIGSFFTWCPEGTPTGGLTLGGPPMLLGPDTENSIIDPNDDSSFELLFVEGYEDWDGECGIGTVPVKILFTREQ